MAKAGGRGAWADTVLPYEPRVLPGNDALSGIASAFNAKFQGFGLRSGHLGLQRQKFDFFNGAHTSGVIFLDADRNNRPHLSFLGHEFGHRLRDDPPDLYNKTVDPMRP